MKNLILTLAVLLLAAPAWADVIITLEDLGEGKIAVNYDATSEQDMLVRAFALDITATDGNIVDINDYAVGDDNGGYGIFPGTFAAANVQVNPTTGNVDNWAVAGYSPVAPADDPDALGGLGTPGVTIEMGSLYDTAAPPKSGMLCTITVEVGTTEVCVVGNAIRGNVVLEDASALIPAQDCIVPDFGGCSLPTCHPDYAQWVAVGKPDCWCNPNQCYGDASNSTEKIGRKWYTVAYNDLAFLVDGWKTKDTTVDPVPAPVAEPAICADFDHASEKIGRTWYRVAYADLGVLVANWKTEDIHAAGDCQDCP